MELIVAAILCVIAGIAAIVAGLGADPGRACLALGVCVASVASLALLHFDAPLAAATILIAHGGLSVVNARLSRQTSAAGGQVRWAWAWFVVVSFAAILAVALLPASELSADRAPSSTGIEAFLVAAVSLAALAAAVGLQAVSQLYAPKENL
jgi:hypothetical protein